MIDRTSTSARRAPVRMWATGALLAAALTACVSQAPAPNAVNVQVLENRARAAAAANDRSAADLYAQLAAATTGTVRVGHLIESARLAIDHGDLPAARRRLGDARADADRDQQQAIAVLLSRVELEDHRPQAALDMLASLQGPLSPAALRDSAAVRGEALFQVGRPVDAVRAFVEREVWLDDSASILANQRMIWNGFKNYPPKTPLPPTGDRIIDGWLALAPVAAGTSDLRRALLAWREIYTDHPAAGGLLAELLAQQRAAGFPAQIALLLPLSSPQRSSALAIRDGFLAAHFRDGSSDGTTIRIYDTNTLGGAQAYLRAQLDGADFIVGPLLKPEVDQVATQAGFVPTLALNFAQSDRPFSGSFYQFALAPQDEARVIADRAIDAGATTAIALVPSNTRGYDILGSFRDEFEARGGQLLDFAGYDRAQQDFGPTIDSLLHITRSYQRERRLQANLGVPIQFEPRRRQDVDMIFFVGDADAARLVAPQLRYHYGGDIPTYATADVYATDSASRDNDLNGMIFADAPSLLEPGENAAQLQAQLKTFWPQRASQPSQLRLYGMGFDAYELVQPLYNGGAAWPLQGMSGQLTLDAQGRIHRDLPLAQFRAGRPAPIEATTRPVQQSGLIGAR